MLCSNHRDSGYVKLLSLAMHDVAIDHHAPSAPAGQEVLDALLRDPEAMGQRIGSLVDAVVDLERLERTVQRNDEVRRTFGRCKACAALCPSTRYHNAWCTSLEYKKLPASRLLQCGLAAH